MATSILRMLALASLLGTQITACVPGESSESDTMPGVTVGPLTVALIDSLPYESELEPGVLHRVVVRRSARADTIPEVTTQQLPLVLDDSVVLGFRFVGANVRDVFRYAPSTRTVTTTALPPDFVSVSWPQFAPDGRHLIYLARDSAGAVSAVVLAWPTTQEIYRSSPATPLATDMGVERLVWQAPRVFTLEIILQEPFRASQRTRGTIGTDGAVTAIVDTVAASG